MPLSTEKIPNLPLTGVELRDRVLYALREELERRLPPPCDGTTVKECIDRIRLETDRDYVFGGTVCYPLAEWKATAKFHFTAPDAEVPRVLYSVVVDFTFRNVSMPKHQVKTRCSPPPLPDRAETGVVAFSVGEKVENPNLIRVASGIPIIMTRAVRPLPGEFIGRIERYEVEYSKQDYPEPPPVVVEDLTAACRAEWGVPEPRPVHVELVKPPAEEPLAEPKRGRGRPPKASYDPKHDRDDLDAIGVEV